MRHELNISPELYSMVKSSVMEPMLLVRKDGFDFHDGDTILLKAYNAEHNSYTGEEMEKTIICMFYDGESSFCDHEHIALVIK